MIRHNRFSLGLLLALGLAGAGCGDDDSSKDGDDGTADGSSDGSADGSTDGSSDGSTDGSTGDGSTGDGGEGLSCDSEGIFSGSTAADVKAALKDTGACRGDADVAEACKLNISDIAATAGRTCVLAGVSDPEQFNTCVLDGDGGTLKGIRDTATEVSEQCGACYVASVVCSKNNCLDKCLDASMEEVCSACRAEKGCTAAFYECSGFPTPQELNP